MIKRYFLIHISAILDGRIFILIKNGIIDGIPLIAEDDFVNLPEEIKKKIDNIKIVKGDIFNVSKRLKCRVIICDDKNTELKLKTLGLKIVDLKYLSVLCRKPLKLGDVIDINMDEKNSRIFLDDGTEVIIDKNEIYGKIKCRISGIIETEEYRKVYCDIEK